MRTMKLWLPVILWAALILSASNDRFSAGHSRGWLSAIVGHEVAEHINIAVRKVGHLIAYGILGALAWRADRRLAVALGIVLLIASADEWKQSFTLTRSGSPWDVLLDVCGGWIGTLAAKRILRG